MFVMGIDIGSAFSKGVVIQDQEILGSYITISGGDYGRTAEIVRDHLLSVTGLSSKDINCTVATGYGSKMVEFAQGTRTDISCHGRGVFHLLPSVRSVVDVGDLHSKAFRIDENGNQLRFLLSGKCAGGSGRILKIIAKVLHVDLKDLGDLSLKSKNRVDFNTGCAVFAESEAISRIAEGVAKEDLLAGIHRALASQLLSLAERVGIEKDLALVGGGAKDMGVVKAMKELTDSDVLVPSDPQITAALGAALEACQMCG